MSGEKAVTFTDEDASEWLDSFAADGASAIETALQTVADFGPNDYLEAAEAAHAVAAAHVVAALRDGDMDGVPDDVVAAIESHAEAIAALDVRAVARKAVLRVLKQSELKDRYEEDGDDEWEATVQAIADRLKK
jgi:hypothetical protein